MWRSSCVALALLLVAACSSDPLCPSRQVNGGGVIVVPLAVAGEPDTVEIPVPGVDANCKSVEFATSALVELLDPEDQPVPTSASPLDGASDVLRVTFTPPVPGSYHLTTRFEPALGTTQLDLVIAGDQRGASFTSLPVPVECEHFGLAGEVAFCLGVSSLATVVDGGVVTQLPAYDFALAPELGGVWVLVPGDVGSDLVQLYSLDGGALTLTGQASVRDPEASNCTPICSDGTQRSLANGRLLASGGRALVVLPPHVGFASVSGGVRYDELGVTMGQPLVQWAGGDTVEIADLLSADLVDFCTLGVDAGLAGACSATAGTLAGTSSLAVWAWNDALQTLEGSGLMATGSPRSLKVMLSQRPDAPPGWTRLETQVSFTVDAGLMLLGTRDGAPSLDLYALPQSHSTVWGADAERIWLWDSDTQRLIYLPR